MSGCFSSSGFGVLSRKQSRTPSRTKMLHTCILLLQQRSALQESSKFLLVSVVLRPTKEQTRGVTFSVGSGIIMGVLLTFKNRLEKCVLSVLLGSSSPTFNPWNSVWWYVSESTVVLLSYRLCILIGFSCLTGLYTRKEGFNHLFLLFSLSTTTSMNPVHRYVCVFQVGVSQTQPHVFFSQSGPATLLSL